jgi:RNA polymerase sigma factor for flagellar operon FliA
MHEQNAEGLILESLYKRLDQRLGHPAGDIEICDAMKITLDEFYQILEQIKGLNLGSFQKMASQNGDANKEPLIRYVPDTSQMDSSVVLRKSEILEMLIKAIEALPKMEQLLVSLCYYDELTLEEAGTVLDIDAVGISQLHTKAMLRLRSKLREWNDGGNYYDEATSFER